MSIAADLPILAIRERTCVFAHNFNNKLSVIIGQCQLLMDHASDPVCARRMSIIYETAKCMADQLKSHECPNRALPDVRAAAEM